MKTRMQMWLARVALSLVAIAAWGTGATAQSLSGVYGGKECDFKLTFRPKDVVYIQFLAGGSVMQELPGQYKVDGDRVAVTAPSWGAVFTRKGDTLVAPYLGGKTVCTKLADVRRAPPVAGPCDQFSPAYNRGNICFDTRPMLNVTTPPVRVHVGNEVVRESVVVSEAKGGSGWRPDQSQGTTTLLWPANASVMPSPALLLLKVSPHGETVEAKAMFPSNVSTFTDAAVDMAKQLLWRVALKDGKAAEAWVLWEFRAVARASGFITVNVSGGPSLVYIDNEMMDAVPVIDYKVWAGPHRIMVDLNRSRGGRRLDETVQVDSGATVVKSYGAVAEEEASGFITVNVSEGPSVVYIDNQQMDTVPVIHYKVTAGTHRIHVLIRGRTVNETVQVESGATVVKSYGGFAQGAPAQVPPAQVPPAQVPPAQVPPAQPQREAAPSSSDISSALLTAKGIVDGASYDTVRARQLRLSGDTANLAVLRAAYANRLDSARTYLAMALASPDTALRINAAAILVRGGAKLGQANIWDHAYPWLDQTLQVVVPRTPSDTTGPRQQIRIQASFWYGLSSVLTLNDQYRAMVNSRSCTEAKTASERIARTKEALMLGMRVHPPTVNQMLQNLGKFEAQMPRVKETFGCDNF